MTLQRLLLAVALVQLLAGCASVPEAPLERKTELNRNLQIVSTDMVSAIIQIRSLNPSTTTVQFSEPESEFGQALLKTFEDAGYGVQIVTGDRGNNYVSYARRAAETDAGNVQDYVININYLELRREYKTTASGIYPTSLMFVNGAEEDINISLDNDIFSEQGGDELFLSGVKPDNRRSLAPEAVAEIAANSNTMIVESRRTQGQTTLAKARRDLSRKEKLYEPVDLNGLSRYKRVIVIFPDNLTLQIGAGNKLAIRRLIQDFNSDDVFEIIACDDFDGKNDRAEDRATKIRDEIISHGIPLGAVRRAPCVRSNFRHQSDNSPIPVAIVQYRK